MISLFSSITNDTEADKRLWDEIFGCVNYLKIPFDTIMSMPVFVRKYWIMRHNEKQEEIKKSNENPNGKSGSIEGNALNAYAEMEQSNNKHKNISK